MDLLHPGSMVTLEALASRLKALEASDQRYAMRGGLAVTYDTNGRIANLNASYINAGAIDASVINVTNLSASNISTGTLSVNRLASGSITGSKIAANTIEADNLAANCITAAKIAAGAIDGLTITGALIRTASSGARVQLSSNSYISLYDAGGNNWSIGAANGSMFLQGDSDIFMSPSSGVVAITSTLDMYGGNIDDVNQIANTGSYLNLSGNLNVTGWGSFGGDVDMNSHYITELQKIVWSTRASAPGDTWALYMYNNSGSYGLRTRMSGGNWEVDQHGV